MSGTRGSPGVFTHYDATSIAVLKGVEAVRRRPAMYVGSTGPEGLHHLVSEVVGNAVDEALSGHCTHIVVTVHHDGSLSVEDNGRGIPVDPHVSDGRPACEVVLTSLHAGGKFNKHAYSLAGGLHGIGLSCVNALSEWLQLTVYRGGRRYRQRYQRGVPASALADSGPSDRHGTTIRFLPDAEIFTPSIEFSAELLAERLTEIAFLNAGLSVTFDDERSQRHHEYAGDGVANLVEHLNQQRQTLHAEVIALVGHINGIEAQIALQWTTAYSDDIRGYVNSVRTVDGGSHVTAMVTAISEAITAYAAAKRFIDPTGGETITALDIREGLTAGISIRMPEPEFEGQTKTRLHSLPVGELVAQTVREQLARYFADNTTVADLIVGRAIEATRARSAARRASEQARYQAVDTYVDEEVYKVQFGIRSKNWHDSAAWITSDGLLTAHAESCRVSPDAVLLDVCCGTGVVGAAFNGRVARKVGLDLTPEMAKIAATRLDEVRLGTIYDLPFPENSFDIVVTREILHLLPRPEVPVSEVFRVLKPGGQFIVGQTLPYSVEDAPWMWRIFKKKQPLIFNMFLEETFREMLDEAGFVDVAMKEQMVWESINLWIDTHETTALHRHEIRRLYTNVPETVRAIHPFEVLPSGEIRDCWRWGIFSSFKPT